MPEAKFPGATCLGFSPGFVAAPAFLRSEEEEGGIKSGYWQSNNFIWTTEEHCARQVFTAGGRMRLVVVLA